jgi:hypothetical protein
MPNASADDSMQEMMDSNGIGVPPPTVTVTNQNLQGKDVRINGQNQLTLSQLQARQAAGFSGASPPQ